MLALKSIVSMTAVTSANRHRVVMSLRECYANFKKGGKISFYSQDSASTSRRAHRFASSSLDEVSSLPSSSDLAESSSTESHGASFPVLKLRGIPFEVEEEGIKDFLGCEPIDVLMVRRAGKRSGEVFVVFASAEDMEKGLSKNMSYMGERYIEVMTAKKTDYYQAISFEVKQGLSDLGTRFSQKIAQRRELLRPATSIPPGETCVLKLRGLPFSTTEGQISEWLADPSLEIPLITSDKILIAYSGKRPSGVAFVEFNSPAEANAALQGKSNQILGGRYIEIFPSDPSEMSKYK
ncbi:hypothetical protein CEUSTIGMA_g13740.t1 [Chlamydomonas eustigma]|uniref:RRM domain-containing protein n=1 Tax=Chlamydomonas eustigma TaxID=1157962 RepID=A0A250XTD6_9CHLO|nr:hypothetical protein CEUSTIGMA_g13740.t1 [Chlamydomonas eustigma]|eukprot:GAX86328.1 hypothetical protein CEUSTIGMA_g13740.t1 [Chlamydomonas eustigma]